MEIIKNLNGNELEFKLVGRLDTTTAPSFDSALKESINGITKLVLDFSKLDYISSAGLRVLLSSQKIMNTQGSLIIKNVNDEIKEVFEITGFIDFLTIE